MNVIRCYSACACLLLVLTSTGANHPYLAPQPQATPPVPYGYYQTQWRPYPTMLFDPELVRTPVEALPTPRPIVPKMPMIKDRPTIEPMPKIEVPIPKIEDPKPKVLEPASTIEIPMPKVLEPTPKIEMPMPKVETPPEPMPKRKIFPPDHIPEVKPIPFEPMPPSIPLEIRTPPVEPQIKIFSPKVEVPEPVKPQILDLLPLPPADRFRRSAPLKEAGEEESEQRLPKPTEMPKAWLELPIPVVMPIVRGSSHEPPEKPVWRPRLSSR